MPEKDSDSALLQPTKGTGEHISNTTLKHNYYKGFANVDTLQTSLGSFFEKSKKNGIIKRLPGRTAIPERHHANHYMQEFSTEAFIFCKNQGIINEQHSLLMDFLIANGQPLTDPAWAWAPMKLYRKYRVFLAEKCPEFQQRLAKVEARMHD